MRYMPVLLLFLTIPSFAVTLKCRTWQGRFILTTAQYCPDGSTFIDADYGGISDYRPSQPRVAVVPERDCTRLKMQADSIAFRIRRGRAFADDAKNFDDLQAQLSQNGCR
jgi:hypothetical protein